MSKRMSTFCVTAVFWLLFPAAVIAAEKGPAVPDYPVDKVAENIYVIHGPVTTPNEKNQGFMNNPMRWSPPSLQIGVTMRHDGI